MTPLKHVVFSRNSLFRCRSAAQIKLTPAESK